MTATTIREQPVLLRENLAKEQPEGGRRFKVRIIEGNRWGSSGYYSESMLRECGATAFPAGTPMYLDHPKESENWERPERSVRDLAAKLVTEGTYENDGLYAEIEVYEHMAEVVNAIAEDVGLSIRAGAVVEHGEAAGRKGPIVKKITEGISVDFVTKAGAGGKVVQLLESAREHKSPDVLAAEVRERVRLAEATYRDRQEMLSNAVKEEHGEENVWIWLRDFDDDNLWYERHSDESSATYQQGYTIDGNDVTLEGDPIEVVAKVVYEPVSESDRTPAKQDVPANPVEGNPTPLKESSVGDVTISESRLRELEEAAKERDALRDQLKESQDKERAALVEGAKETRRANVAEAKLVVFKKMTKKGISGDRLAESLSTNPPLTEDGKVDTKALEESVDETLGEITAQVDESVGGVRGFGQADSTELSEADVDAAVAGAWGSTREVKA